MEVTSQLLSLQCRGTSQVGLEHLGPRAHHQGQLPTSGAISELSEMLQDIRPHLLHSTGLIKLEPSPLLSKWPAVIKGLNQRLIHGYLVFLFNAH